LRLDHFTDTVKGKSTFRNASIDGAEMPRWVKPVLQRCSHRVRLGPDSGRAKRLLAFVPNVGRELPVFSNLLPHHDILAGNFLRC
jgi:hypothetical protein